MFFLSLSPDVTKSQRPFTWVQATGPCPSLPHRDGPAGVGMGKGVLLQMTRPGWQSEVLLPQVRPLTPVRLLEPCYRGAGKRRDPEDWTAR